MFRLSSQTYSLTGVLPDIRGRREALALQACTALSWLTFALGCLRALDTFLTLTFLPRAMRLVCKSQERVSDP